MPHHRPSPPLLPLLLLLLCLLVPGLPAARAWPAAPATVTGFTAAAAGGGTVRIARADTGAVVFTLQVGVAGRARPALAVAVERARIVVRLALAAPPGALCGAAVNHTVWFPAGAPATGATVPGALEPFACSSLNLAAAGAPGTPRGSFGNPTLHMRTAAYGLGLLPLDDVFELHAWGQQRGLARYPRMPAGSAPCAVTDPPSLALYDTNLALRPNTTYG